MPPRKRTAVAEPALSVSDAPATTSDSEGGKPAWVGSLKPIQRVSRAPRVYQRTSRPNEFEDVLLASAGRLTDQGYPAGPYAFIVDSEAAAKAAVGDLIRAANKHELGLSKEFAQINPDNPKHRAEQADACADVEAGAERWVVEFEARTERRKRQYTADDVRQWFRVERQETLPAGRIAADKLAEYRVAHGLKPRAN